MFEQAACTLRIARNSWVVLILIAAILCGQTDFIFPSGAGVIDVTRFPYGADKTGATDATVAIQTALDTYAAGNRIIYLPNGTYLVSNTLRWGDGAHGGEAQKKTIMQGQSRDGVIIKLQDNCPGFQTATDAGRKPVLWTGIAPAQRFRNAIWSLTVNTGSGNPGASGIQYMANNQGTMRHVKIISGDGEGYAGLDVSYADEIGPAYIFDLEVQGFNYGVSAYVLNSLSFEKVRLEGQKIAGFRNWAHVVSLRDIVSVNSVPAIMNDDGVMALLDCDFSGGAGSNSAIVNNGALFARAVTSAGYSSALSGRSGVTIDEYVSAGVQSQFTSPERSIGLDVAETPDVPWDTPSQWTSPDDYAEAGAADDTKALQDAIDAGKTTVYMAGGSMYGFSTVRIRGAVRRIIGCESAMVGTLIVEDGSSPVVIVERFGNNGADALGADYATLINQSSRTLVVRSCTGLNVVAEGSGDIFIEDYCSGTLRLNTPGQRTWARQVNTESGSETNIINDGGILWLFGYKTEQEATKIETKNGGITEVIGAHIYAQGEAKTTPLFIINNASASFAAVRQLSYGDKYYNDYVRETRGDQTQTLTLSNAGATLALYTGYAEGAIQTRGVPLIVSQRAMPKKVLAVAQDCYHPQPGSFVFDMSGRLIRSQSQSRIHSPQIIVYNRLMSK